MNDSLEDLGEDFYDNDFHDEEEHHDGNVGDDHHEYEQNFGGDVYDEDYHPENNPYEEEMYHPGEEQPQEQETYDQHTEEQNAYEEQHFEENYEENYEEEQPSYEDKQIEEQHNEETNDNEMNNIEQENEDGQGEAHFDDFDPYESYESDNQVIEQPIQDAQPETLQEQVNQEPNHQEELLSTGQAPKPTIRERPKSAPKPVVRAEQTNTEKKKASSRPSSTEKKKQFTTVEEYIYKPYYENRQKFYDENEIREYMKEKRRKEKEKLKMKPQRNNNNRKKPYDEEKVKEFMKLKQVSDRKIAEQKKQEEIQKKIGKKDALKKLDQYIHELFVNPPPVEEKKSKKKKPEMPQFLKDQLFDNENIENIDNRKRVKDFGKKVRSKLALDHEKKKLIKAAAEKLAQELRRRNMHKIRHDDPPKSFNNETDSTNSSVWSLWSAPPRPMDNSHDLFKGKTEIRDFSVPTPRHVNCTYTDISSIEPRLNEAEIQRRQIIDNALQLISSARKAKEDIGVKSENTLQNKELLDTSKSTISSSEKPLSSRILTKFQDRKSKSNYERQDLIESPSMHSVEKPTEGSTQLNQTKPEENVSTPDFRDSLSESIASSPSIVHSEYSVKSDKLSVYPFSSQLKRAESESSSLDNSNLDTIEITIDTSKEKYFNPIEYESYHNSNKSRKMMSNTEMSEGTNSESSIIVDSSSENSFDDTEEIREYATFNPSTALFNDDLLRKDNAKEIELHFSKPKEKRILSDPNFNSYTIEPGFSLSSTSFNSSSSEIEKRSYFTRRDVAEREGLQDRETESYVKISLNRKPKQQEVKPIKEERKIKSALLQSTSSTSSLRTSSDYGKEFKQRNRSRPTSNETSSISSDISSNASLISIENDSETSALLEEVRKKKEEIKKQVFMSLKNSSEEKIKSSYKRNKSKISSKEVDPFNIISTIKSKNISDKERERQYKRENIKKEIKQYRESKPAGLEPNVITNKVPVQTQTQSNYKETSKSIEVQTTTPVEIVYDSSEEKVLPQEFNLQDIEPKIDSYLYEYRNLPVFMEPEVERLSPDELVERLLDSLQVYEKVFESDVRLTRLLASATNGPYT